MPVSSRSSRSAACTGVSPGTMCPCTVSHDPGERPPGARRSTSTSSPAPPDRSRYASMKETCTEVTNQRRRPSTASNRAESARARNGFVRKSSAPSSNTRTSLSSSLFAVRTMTGMSATACCPTCGRVPPPQVGQHAVAVEPDDVRAHPVDLIEGLHPVARLGDDVAVALEQIFHDLAQAVLVVHEQHLARRQPVRPRNSRWLWLLQQLEVLRRLLGGGGVRRLGKGQGGSG